MHTGKDLQGMIKHLNCVLTSNTRSPFTAILQSFVAVSMAAT